MVKNDFTGIHMNKAERCAMRKMALHIHVKVNDANKSLIANRFAEYTKTHVEDHMEIIDSNCAKLTEKGKAYIEHCSEQFCKDYFFDIVNFCVALAALILSILK